jgi:hypothetical protein
MRWVQTDGPSSQRTTDRRIRLRSSSWVVPVALFLVALAIRLPELTSIPPPTDETDELLWSLAIYRSERWPLTASDPYIGPLANYLTAASYALFGASFAAGRAAAVALGALIAPATWALARIAGGPGRGDGAGLLAGLLAAVAFGPVVMSHVAWSHGGAPALFALALAAFIAALQARAPRMRAAAALAAGVLGGLAVGAHPTVLAFAPGMAVGWWLVARRPVGLAEGREGAGPQANRNGEEAGELDSRRVLGWMILGLLIGSAPGLVFLVREGVTPFLEAAADRSYVGLGLAGWPVGVAAWLSSLLRNLIGPADVFDSTSVGEPWIWLGAAVVVGLLVLAWTRQGWQRCLATVVFSGALLMPLIVEPDKFLSLTGLRYSAPALPALLSAMALGAMELLRRGPHRVIGVAATLGLVLTLAYAPIATYRFYAETKRSALIGTPVIEVVSGLAAGAGGRDTLFIDPALDTKLAGGGEVGRAIGALLTLRGIAYERAKVDKIRWFLVNGNGATYDLVLSGDTADALGAEFALEPIRIVPVVEGQVSRSGDYWGWYRMRTRGH